MLALGIGLMVAGGIVLAASGWKRRTV